MTLVPMLRVGMPSWTLRVLFAGLGGLRFERRRTRTTRSVEDSIPTEDRGNEWKHDLQNGPYQRFDVSEKQIR